MNKTQKKVLRESLQFLGPKVTFWLGMGILTGFGLFAVEIAFAYSLQSFLLHIGALEKGSLALPSWLMFHDWRVSLGVIFLVGLLRSLLVWLQTCSQGAVYEEFRYLLRSRIVNWAFNSESASSSEVIALFALRTEAASIAVGGIQVLAVQLTVATLMGISLLLMAPWATLAAGVVALALAPLMRWADRRSKESGEGLQKNWQAASERLLISIKNLVMLQIYGTHRKEEAKAQINLRSYREHASVHYIMYGFKYAVPQIAGLLLICLISLAARSSFHIHPGILVTYFYLFLRLSMSLGTMGATVSDVIVRWPPTLLLFRWWEDHGDEIRRNAQAAAYGGEPAEGLSRAGWRLSSVSFAYPGGTAPIISDMNLNIDPGRLLVIMGPSGSGKSTLLYLLIGRLQPDTGTVEVVLNGSSDRQPLEVVRPQLLKSIGYVGPDSFLIEGSILTNITYGLGSTPSPEELADALAKAECQFVFSLPQGLDYWLTEQGQGLSAGQKQRLSLARAFLRKPSVLILDEATSNLDMETESRIAGTLAKLKGQLTIIVVTHRTTFLGIADECVRLNESAPQAPNIPAESSCQPTDSR